MEGVFFETSKATTQKYIFGYLPTIRSSAKMETVNELLMQIKKKAQQLNLTETYLFLDHAISCVGYHGRTTLWIGEISLTLEWVAFKPKYVFLGVIGKQFGDAGLKGVMVEIGILGEDGAQKFLRGKHYNNGMRKNLYIAEATTRVKLDAFRIWLHLMTTLYWNRMKLERLKNSVNVKSPKKQWQLDWL